jgi:hypothetical protein
MQMRPGSSSLIAAVRDAYWLWRLGDRVVSLGLVVRLCSFRARCMALSVD